MSERRDAIVIGGGVSGLADAFHLARAGVAVTLLEATERVGGVLETCRDGEWVAELGPNTVAERAPLAEAIEAAGVGAERVPASPAASRRYLWQCGALRGLPQSPPQLLTSSLLSWRGKAALAREARATAAAPDRAESVADFVRRRFGTEA